MVSADGTPRVVTVHSIMEEWWWWWLVGGLVALLLLLILLSVIICLCCLCRKRRRKNKKDLEAARVPDEKPIKLDSTQSSETGDKDKPGLVVVETPRSASDEPAKYFVKSERFIDLNDAVKSPPRDGLKEIFPPANALSAKNLVSAKEDLRPKQVADVTKKSRHEGQKVRNASDQPHASAGIGKNKKSKKSMTKKAIDDQMVGNVAATQESDESSSCSCSNPSAPNADSAHVKKTRSKNETDLKEKSKMNSGDFENKTPTGSTYVF